MDDILQAARMSEEELRRELAVLLFQQDRLTLPSNTSATRAVLSKTTLIRRSALDARFRQ